MKIIYFSTLFVKDAFSDLPHEADLSATGKESLKSWQRAYDSAPQSHFQRKMRKMSTDLIDHLSQRPNPLNQARYVVERILHKDISYLVKPTLIKRLFLGLNIYRLVGIGEVRIL